MPTPVPTEAPAPAPQQTATPETARAPVLRALPEMTAQPAAVTGVVLIDSIAADGCLTAQVNGSDEKLPGAVYTWYRSRDGADWQTVTPQICSGSGRNIEAGSEQRLNAALDSCVAGIGDADRLYYKVEVTGADGTAAAAQTRVAYYIQLQNGSFEAPAVAGSSALYYPFTAKRSHFIQTADADTNPAIVWRTTGAAPHWSSLVNGHYIELVDGTGRSYTDVIDGEIRTDPNDPSVCYHTPGAYDGSQFAELNCQAYGALYQDVLTGEGTVLSFDANGRATITETIRANQKIEVTGLPEGALYTIAEGGDDAAKYTTDWATPTGTVEDTPTLAQRAMTAADADITVTNTREAAAPTGLLLDAAPYGAMLALAAGSGAVFFRKRRRGR